MMIRALSPVLIFLMFGLSQAELPLSWVSPGDQDLEDMMRLDRPMGGERPDRAALLERGLSLDTCHVQRRVLERLRELVVESIDQVKRCLNPTSSPYRSDQALDYENLNRALFPRMKL